MTNPSSDVLERLRGHTPGPWGVEATDFNLWIGPMRPDGHKVERVVVAVDADPTYTETATIERSANAALIAEAPTMFATIERLSAELERVIDDGVATLAAVRATSRSDEWKNSADHFHRICGETILRMNAAKAAALTLPQTNYERSQSV